MCGCSKNRKARSSSNQRSAAPSPRPARAAITRAAPFVASAANPLFRSMAAGAALRAGKITSNPTENQRAARVRQQAVRRQFGK